MQLKVLTGRKNIKYLLKITIKFTLVFFGKILQKKSLYPEALSGVGLALSGAHLSLWGNSKTLEPFNRETTHDKLLSLIKSMFRLIHESIMFLLDFETFTKIL